MTTPPTPQDPKHGKDQGWPSMEEWASLRRGHGWRRFCRYSEGVFFSGLLLMVVILGIHLGLSSDLWSSSTPAGESTLLGDDDGEADGHGVGEASVASASGGRFDFEIFPDGEDLIGGEPFLPLDDDLGEPPLIEPDGRVLEPVDAPVPEMTSGAPETSEASEKNKAPKRLGILRLRADHAWDVEAVYKYASLVWGLE